MRPELHVLIIPSWYPSKEQPLDGIFFREQALALHKAGIKTGVAYPEIRHLRNLSASSLKENHFQTSTFVDGGVPTFVGHGWNLLPKLKMLHRVWSLAAKVLVRKYIREHGTPTIIHAHSTVWAGYAARVIANELNIPYVITEHSSSYARQLIQPWQKPHIRRALQSASRVVTVSTVLQKELEAYVPSPASFLTIPNRVDTDFFKLKETPRSLGARYRFLTVAFLHENKGIDVLIRAFHRSFRESNTAELLIGGDGPDRPRLEALVRESGLESQVRFLGLLSRNEVRSNMRDADSFVLPSYHETFGVVLIEAMSTGLPIVCTKCGGPEDFFKESCGYIVEPGDTDQLAEALRLMYMNRDGFDSKSIREYALSRFSDDAVTSRLKQVYEDVIRTATKKVGVF